jgi:ferredoxin
MPLLNVDTDNCTRDGRCVDECPACIIELMIGVPKYRYHRVPLRNEARITWK